MNITRFSVVGFGTTATTALAWATSNIVNTPAVNTPHVVDTKFDPVPLPVAQRLADEYFSGKLSFVEVVGDHTCAAIAVLSPDSYDVTEHTFSIRSPIDPSKPEFADHLAQCIGSHIPSGAEALDWKATAQFTVWDHDTRRTLMARSTHLPAPEMLLSRGYLPRHHTCSVTARSWTPTSPTTVDRFLLFGITTQPAMPAHNP